MTRLEFTEKLARLILRMRTEKEDPILVYIAQLGEEQGKAAALLFMNLQDKDLIGPPAKGYRYWHKVWEGMGGRPINEQEKGHFEG